MTNCSGNVLGIKDGDILVWNDSVKGQSRYGALIRIATASDFTHVGIAVFRDGELYVAEANIPFVRISKVNINDSLFYIPTPVIHDLKGEEFFKDTFGLKYSYMDAVMSVFGIVSKKDSKYQCAEYVVDYLKLYGFNLGNSYTPSKLVKSAMHLFKAPLIPIIQ